MRIGREGGWECLKVAMEDEEQTRSLAADNLIWLGEERTRQIPRPWTWRVVGLRSGVISMADDLAG